NLRYVSQLMANRSELADLFGAQAPVNLRVFGKKLEKLALSLEARKSAGLNPGVRVFSSRTRAYEFQKIMPGENAASRFLKIRLDVLTPDNHRFQDPVH